MSEQNDLELYVENARLRNANEKLLAEIDRLRDDLHTQADWADWAKGEMERMTHILDNLREPRKAVVDAMMNWLVWTDGPYVKNAVRAAVAAAEQEVGRDIR